MSKRAASKYKISRRLGAALWGTAKDAFNVKNYGPGQHGPQGKRKAESDFGKQLRAKQQLKGYYGNISEKQFRGIYKRAIRMKGDSSENLIGLLERRLDIVVYRMNFVGSVFAARQLVNHKHVLVNGKAVNIASYRLNDGDVVELREKSKQIPQVLESTQKQERAVPEYLTMNSTTKGTYTRAPKLADVPYAVVMEPNLVIEYYSR